MTSSRIERCTRVYGLIHFHFAHQVLDRVGHVQVGPQHVLRAKKVERMSEKKERKQERRKDEEYRGKERERVLQEMILHQ